uniref:Uncharacterized protein n=1 Tax=Rhizophora mucronata TaxID=61149 RepID=A0A2P2P8B6_RHIMU
MHLSKYVPVYKMLNLGFSHSSIDYVSLVSLYWSF